MEQLKIHSTTVAPYEIREQPHRGRKHLIVPVVMMVEGVHSGSHGPIMHRINDLGRHAEAWNGIPIMVRHPQDEQGNYVSARSPSVVETAVGTVYNTHVEGEKLKAEAWIDELKILSVSPTALDHIRLGQPLEVSVGVFSDQDAEEGEWNGERYDAVARNHRPDHLALLPGERGACSWDDGCGIRANKANEVLTLNNKGDEMTQEQEKALKDLAVQGFILSTNVQGYQELMSKIQRKLDAKDNETSMHFLEEVYDGYFVYRQNVRESGEVKLYRQDYSVNSADEVEFGGDPVKVRRDVTYIQANEMKRTKFNVNQKAKGDVMSEEKKTPCGNCMEKVVALINNTQTHFTKSDREWLLEQDENTLDKLFPKDPEPVQVNREQALEVLKEELSDPVKAIEVLSGEAKAHVETGLKAFQEKRTALIEQIQANSDEGVWSDEDLKDTPLEMLERIARTAKAPVDYSANGGGGKIVNNASGDMLLPPGVEQVKQ